MADEHSVPSLLTVDFNRGVRILAMLIGTSPKGAAFKEKVFNEVVQISEHIGECAGHVCNASITLALYILLQTQLEELESAAPADLLNSIDLHVLRAIRQSEREF